MERLHSRRNSTNAMEVNHVYRLFSLLFATIAGLTVPVALAAAPASAQSSASLLCQVIPSRSGAHTGSCGTFLARSNYVVDMGVANGPTDGYSWTVPDGYTVVGGCSSSTPFCDLSARGVPEDQSITTSVQFTQDGVTESLSVTAFIPAFCGLFLC
jgi:hypothetical protein